MMETWLSWVYRLHGQGKEPLAGRLEAEGVRMRIPPLEQAGIEEGICLISEGAEGKEARWLQVSLPHTEKKGFLQWAMRVLLGRAFTGKKEKERFWSAAGPAVLGALPLNQNGVLCRDGLIGQAMPLSAGEQRVLSDLQLTEELRPAGNCRGENRPGVMGKEAVDIAYRPVLLPQEAVWTQESAEQGETIIQTRVAYDRKPDVSSPALLRFRAIYMDAKARKQKKLWMEYFMSEEFLAVWRQPSFTAGLLSVVRSVEEPPPVPFLRQLCISYGILYRRLDCLQPDGSMRYQYQPCLFQGAEFPGVDAVVEISGMGEPIVHLSHLDERVRAAGFVDFWTLLALGTKAREARFALLAVDFEKIFACYRPECLEKPRAGERGDGVSRRDMCGLSLLAQYLGRSDTQEEVLRLAVRILDLSYDSSMMGKHLYGPLRQAVEKRMPELLQEKRNHFLVALKAYSSYRTWSFDRQCREDTEDEARVRRLFSYENMKLALQDETFAKEQVLPYWLNLHRTDAFLRSLQEFCRAHEESGCCHLTEVLCGELLRAKKLAADGMAAEMRPDPLLYRQENGPFWWYFLRVAFLRDMDEGDTAGAMLSELMQKEVPDIRWERAILDFSEERDGPALGRMISVPIGSRFLHLQLHTSYLQYYLDDQPIWRPLFRWEWVRVLPDGPLFWFLLPLTGADRAQRREIEPELRRRLYMLPLPGCRHERAAALLTDYLLHPTQAARTVQMVRREIKGILYRFLAYEDGTLRCFCQQKENQYGRGNYGDVQEAVTQGLEWLAAMEALHEETPCLPWERLPDTVHIRRYCQPAVILNGAEEITPEEVSYWVDVFLSDRPGEVGHVKRLELSWGDRMAGPESGKAADSLVLREENGRYMAIYFRGRGFVSVYGAIGRRELYLASGNHEMEVFGELSVPGYFIHPSRERLAGQIHELLRQIGAVGQPSLDFPKWSFFPVRTGNGQAFKRAKRELGGFEEEAARNRLHDKLEPSPSPDWIVLMDAEGRVSQQKGSVRFGGSLQMLVQDFFEGRITMLQAGWSSKGEPVSSLLLLRDGERYLMLHRNDKRKSGNYWVGDRQGYLNAEGKVRKIDFCGKKVEFYLLHDTPQTIRDGLDLLLPNILQAERITQTFLSWSYTGAKELASLPALWKPPEEAGKSV